MDCRRLPSTGGSHRRQRMRMVGVARLPAHLVSRLRTSPSAMRRRRFRGCGRALDPSAAARRAHLLLGHRRHCKRAAQPRPARPLSELSLPSVLHRARHHRRGCPSAGDRPADHATTGCGGAGPGADPGAGRARRGGEPGQRRQLHVPAAYARRAQPARPDGTVAVVHRRGGRPGGGDLRGARPAGCDRAQPAAEQPGDRGAPVSAASFLSPAETRTLQAICDALLPSIDADNIAGERREFLSRSASDVDAAGLLVLALASESSETRARFRQLLGLMGSWVFGLAMTGRPRGFAEMAPPLRERALRRMAESPLPILRRAFQALKRPAAFIFYALPENPSWKAIGYAPNRPAHGAAVSKPIPTLSITGDAGVTADAVVVRPGAGGCRVAAEVAAAGSALAPA